MNPVKLKDISELKAIKALKNEYQSGFQPTKDKPMIAGYGELPPLLLAKVRELPARRDRKCHWHE